MSARLICLCCCALTFLVSALATGTRVYYYFVFVLFGMLLFSAVSVLLTRATLRIRIKGVKSRVERGETLAVILKLSNRSPLPIGRITLSLSLPGATGGREITAALSPLSEQSFRSVVGCPHRGSYDIGLSDVRIEDIFGLMSITKKAEDSFWHVEVYPKSFRTDVMMPRASEYGSEYRLKSSEDNASPSDVRKWQEGDELKKVHWKLSLRKREIMVRTFEESARPDTLIVPDMTALTALADQKLVLEDRICEAALSCAKAQLEALYPVRMPIEGAHPREVAGSGATDLPAFTDALMRASFDSPYPYEQVLMLLQRRAQRTGGMILVTARLTPRVADIAIRLKTSGIAVRFIYVTDAPREDALAMLERMRMSGIVAERSDPWSDENETDMNVPDEDNDF